MNNYFQRKRFKAVRCMICNKKIEKDELAFLHASSGYKNNIHFRSMCIDCQLNILMEATANKYVKKSTFDRFIARKV